jgi:hypothetical protein
MAGLVGRKLAFAAITEHRPQGCPRPPPHGTRRKSHRSPPPSFHYTSRSRDKPLTAAAASRARDGSRAGTHKGRALSANTTHMSYITVYYVNTRMAIEYWVSTFLIFNGVCVS